MGSRKALLAGLIVILVLLAGCTSFKLSGAQMTAQLPSYTSVGTFDIDVWVNKFLGNSGGTNLFNITADATDAPIFDAIQREIKKYSGDAAVNITIDYQASFVNILLNAVTGGIYAPAEAHITGTIVRSSRPDRPAAFQLMRRLLRFAGLCLLLSGCAVSQPAGEIMAAFKSFLVNVKAGDQARILSTAPFLSGLPAAQKESALSYFRRLAAQDPQRLHLFVSRDAAGRWLLHVSAPGEQSAIVVQFRRNDLGQWEMSPTVSETRQIDIVPAR